MKKLFAMILALAMVLSWPHAAAALPLLLPRPPRLTLPQLPPLRHPLPKPEAT